MARNGTDFGIQVSGTGDAVVHRAGEHPEGLFLGAFGPDDANPDIGDSAITETAGIGGMAMATAPAIVRFVGGSVPDALATTQRMYDITVGGEPGLRASRSWSSAARRPASTSPRWCAPACCRRSTPGWPAGWPAPVRSAPGSSRRRWRASPRPSTPSPPPPGLRRPGP